MIEFPRVVWEFLAATNSGDRAWLEALFADDCMILACGFRVSGRSAVAAWSDAEVMEAEMGLTLLDVRLDDGVTMLRVRASEHGFVHDCDLEFRTEGRYITSLTISVGNIFVSPKRHSTEARFATTVSP